MWSATKRCRSLALFITLLILPIVVGLAYSLVVTGAHNSRLSLQKERGQRTVLAAEAGASVAVSRLQEDTGFSSAFWYTLPNLGERAWVRVTNNQTGAGSQFAANGARVPPGFAYVLSSCTSRDGRLTRGAGVLVRLSGTNPFKWAAFGNEFVRFSGGATTDSWNSSQGSYAQTRQNTGGDVGTNATEAGVVSLSGNGTTVQGQVAVGVGGTLSTAISAASSAYQGGSVLTSPFSMPAVSIPSELTANFRGTFSGSNNQSPPPGYYGEVSMQAGRTLTLQPGTYVFDSLSLSGNASLITPSTGQVWVYITGKNGSTLDLSGGSVATPSNRSRNLIFFVAGSAPVKLSGGSSAYGVYSPRAAITVTGGADIWGSLIGRSITNTGGTRLHYDRDIGSVGVASARVQAWQRF